MYPIKRQKQRGMSLMGMIFVTIVVIFLALIFIKTAPTVSEYFTVKRVINTVVNGTDDYAIRENYRMQAAIDGLHPGPVDPKDLKITIAGGVTTISFAYNKEIELFGPVYLLIKYSGSRTSSSYK